MFLINHFVGYHFFRICFFTADYSRAILYTRTGWVLYSIYASLNKLNHLFPHHFECVHMVVTRSLTTKKNYMYNKNTKRITIIYYGGTTSMPGGGVTYAVWEKKYKQNRLIKIKMKRNRSKTYKNGRRQC